MIINHNLNAMNAHRNMSLNNISQGKSSEKLSSGYRINRAADDAAGLSISEKMRTQIRSLNQAQANSQDGISLVQTAEGAMNEVSDMLSRMKELAVKAANGTYNGSDLAAINQEFSSLSSAIDNIAQKTKFNGIGVLNSTGNVTIQIGDNAGDIVTVSLQDIKVASLSINGADLTSMANASAALVKIDTDILKVNSARSAFGAVQNQLEHTYNNLGTTTENLQAAESRIRDTDMAKEMMNYTKLNILQQASNSMLAQANQAPQGVLQLLR
ncbi:flagellin [Paenibacillus tyrfis]|uniref:flagellin N-terminal helical domain-containing protein n=1 Tax=Paenibacillus TaxID=44249 RepID=UPI001C1F4345|nr:MULTISPECIES: flagellin [Paenibacillus]MBU7317600.1 flagellin [Paenibacillus oleatilyticus]GLI08699.1 flagellin [Paenibacillus tyrfis]